MPLNHHTHHARTHVHILTLTHTIFTHTHTHTQIKRQELQSAKERLENGVDKIAQASAQVADLQIALKDDLVVVEEKKAQTDKLIVSIGKEKAVVDEAVEVRGGVYLCV